MKRVAYGFRDERHFQLRLYALHDCRITPNVDEANFLGNRYSVRTQDKYFVRLRVDGDVSREGFSVLGGNSIVLPRFPVASSVSSSSAENLCPI